MKKFVFTLQTVLNVKETIEKQHKDAIAAIEMKLTRQHEDLHNMQTALTNAKQQLLEELQKGSNALIMATYRDYFELQKIRIENQQREITNTENEKARVRRLLMQAMQERKVLEKLKEKQRADYKIEVTREEERVISESLGSKVARKEESGEEA